MSNNRFKRKPITMAVRAATAMMAISAASNVAAQENSLEEITVTGSNIPRAISDSPSPITIIDSLDIELSGISNTAELLRNTAYNSFGSFRERSGSSFGQISTVNLRGLGSQYTAVLINGRRVPGSPLTGASIVDLNTIPVSAIESISILKDSANAVYGADAIGGVIDIRLRDDFEGFEIAAGIEAPSLPGADSESFKLLWGKNYDRGNVMVGLEYFNKDGISDGDREYSRADNSGSTFGGTTGVSVGGNTAFETDFSDAFALGTCDPSIYAGVFTGTGFSSNPNDTGCGFAYADVSFQTGNLERTSVFLSADYELSEDSELYIDARLNQNETSGRYAPAVGFFSFPESAPSNTFGRDLFAFHRFVAFGNRDDSTDIDELTINTGLKGEFGNGISYDAWVQYFDYSGDELGDTYIQQSVLEAEVVAGNYNVLDPFSQDPNHLAAIDRSAIQLSRDLLTENISAGITFNGEAFELGGGNVGWAAGIEYSDEDYTDIYDEFREAIDVIGSAGNSASGGRDRYAAFAEARFPLSDNFEINLAGRFDDYSDFGDAFSPSVAIRYTPSDNWTIRASAGEGFKAPNLTDLFQSLSQSFDQITDLTLCNATGIPAASCSSRQVENFTGGNDSLSAEESENFNFGVVADYGVFAASLDVYSVEITDQVTTLSLDQVIDREIEGTLPDGVIINRGAPGAGSNVGAIIDIINPLSNGASLETEGLDLGVNFNFETGIGNIDTNISWVHVLKYDQQTTPDSEVDELVGTEDGEDPFPEDRITTTIRLNRDNLTFSLNSSYISSFENVSETGRYPSYVKHDFTVNYVDAFGVDGLDLTAGFLNLTEEDPSLDPTDGYSDDIVLQLYDVSGRVSFINFKYRFGG